MRSITFAVFLFGLVSSAHASPAWTEEVPQEDSEYKYYVGRSTPSPSEAQGFREAIKDAVEQAVKENFGVLASISSDSYQTETETRGNVRVLERSRDVQVTGFERVKHHTEKTEAGTSVTVLCRYSKTAIRKEKARLDRVPVGETLDEAFSSVGGTPTVTQTSLNIVSDPPGAKVVIAGEIYGKTPVVIRGQLPAGPVSVIVDHPSYETETYDAILIPGEAKAIRARLKRASGLLDVHSDPSGARVYIDEVDFGETPLRGVRMNAGQSYAVRVVHPTSEPITQSLVIDRGVTRRLDVSLPLKPAHLTYKVEPSDAVVFIDGKAAYDIGSLVLAPGTHTFSATRDGFIPREERLILYPGEERDLGEVVLVSRSDDEIRRERSPWIFGAGIGAISSPLPTRPYGGGILTLSLEKRFYRFFALGVRGGGSMNVGGQSTQDHSEHEIYASEAAAQARLGLVGGFQVTAETGRISGKYSHYPRASTTGSVGPTTESFSSVFRGYGVAYEWRSFRINLETRSYRDLGSHSEVVRLEYLYKW